MAKRKKVIIIGSLLTVAILGAIITFRASQIYPLSFNKTQKTTINLVQKAWDLTGFYDKKLWDWLELSSRLAIPILIAVFTYIVQKRDKEKTEKQAELEREIARNNLAEEGIQAYLDNMAKLLLNKKIRKELFPNNELKLILNKELRKDKLKFLNKEDNDNPVRDVARTQTITILRRLEDDKERQERIINFLSDAELYQFIFQNANLSKIDLSQNNLSWANLQYAKLERANLQYANLWRANLQRAILFRANLQGAKLEGADLQNTYLSEANLQSAYLYKANLQGAKLEGANLQNALLSDANLQNTSLREANFQDAILVRVNLQGAILWDANLQGAKLEGADLQGANLQGANLQQAILQEVKNSTPQQIKSARFWEKAIYKSKWNWNMKKNISWIAIEAIEPDNTNFIEELKKNTTSDPKEPPDHSI